MYTEMVEILQRSSLGTVHCVSLSNVLRKNGYKEEFQSEKCR